MQLPDNYFRGKSPAEIVAKVATITLANISLLGEEELRRIGWLDNPIVEILYSLTSAGVWTSIRDSSGREYGVNAVTDAYLINHAKVDPPYFSNITVDSIVNNNIKKYAVIPITTSGAGAAADTVCVTGMAGLKGCMEIIGIISSITEGTTTIDFEDEDNTDLEGNLNGGFALNLTASTMNTQLTGLILRGTVAAKSLECDVTGHGAGGTILLFIRYWGEA